jgi:hypothetical protein
VDPGYLAWRDLAVRLGEVGYAVLGAADGLETGTRYADARVVALTLLCRTLSNLKGVLVVADERRVVEARILARACVENLITVGALRDGGDAFVKEMGFADMKKRHAQAQYLLERHYEDATGWKERLQEFLKNTKEFAQQGKSLDVRSLARKGPVADSYVVYSRLSADAAHPTTDALCRYLSHSADDGGRVIDAEPAPSPAELTDTAKTACDMVLGVIVGVNEILGGTAANPLVQQVFEEFDALSARRAGGP